MENNEEFVKFVILFFLMCLVCEVLIFWIVDWWKFYIGNCFCGEKLKVWIVVIIFLVNKCSVGKIIFFFLNKIM